MKIRKLFVFLLFLTLMFSSSSSFAEDIDCSDDGSGAPTDPGCDPDNAPLDSGVGLLIGVTALYTIKRISKK